MAPDASRAFASATSSALAAKHRRPRAAQLRRGRLENSALHLGRRLRQDRGGRARGAAELEHALAQAVGKIVLDGAHDGCFVLNSTKSSR